MPLPDYLLALNGGCNCGAIRYKIDTPSKADCPLYPLSKGEVSFPVVLTDHCNDCRKATGSILPTWICVPTTMMTCMLQPIAATEDGITRSEATWLPVDYFFILGR